MTQTFFIRSLGSPDRSILFPKQPISLYQSDKPICRIRILHDPVRTAHLSGYSFLYLLRRILIAFECLKPVHPVQKIRAQHPILRKSGPVREFLVSLKHKRDRILPIRYDKALVPADQGFVCVQISLKTIVEQLYSLLKGLCSVPEEGDDKTGGGKPEGSRKRDFWMRQKPPIFSCRV